MIRAMKQLHVGRRLIALMLVASTLGMPAHAAANTASGWTTTNEAMLGRAYLAAVTGPDGKIYTLGGSHIGGFPNQQNIAEAYDPRTGTVETLPPMPRVRDSLALFTFGGHGDQPPFTDVQIYTP